MSPQMMAESKKTMDKHLKEEKERLLDEKMRVIRQKNEERLKRQKEIEEDIRNANSHSEEVVMKTTTNTRGSMSGVYLNDKPTVSKFRGRARGKILEKMSKELPQAQKFKERQRANYQLVEKELKEEKASPGHGFLSDDHRVDMSKMASRSAHSWGGSQFEDVVGKVKSRESRYKRDQRNPVINMTGKERLKYQEWKEERTKVDQARQSRQKRGDTWQREWDKVKVKDNTDPIGRRQDYHCDRTRSGQRFKERPRHKPDWDLHDDREEEDTLCINQNNLNTAYQTTLEDCRVYQENTPNKNEDSVLPTSKNEDWEEETQETVDIPSLNNKHLKESDQSTVEVSDIELQNTNKIIDNLTVTVDSQGHRDIKEPCDNKEKLLDESVQKSNDVNENDTECLNDSTGESTMACTSSISNKEIPLHAINDNNLSTKLNSREEANTKDATRIVPKTDKDLPTEQDYVETKDITNKEQSTDIIKSTVKESRQKDIIPKLDLTKTDDKEPVPDFLKTPQHKDWADYDFDEEELEFSRDLSYFE